MKWRVMVEVTGEDGAVTQPVISAGERSAVGQAVTLGLRLAEGKAPLAGVQRVLATALPQARSSWPNSQAWLGCGMAITSLPTSRNSMVNSSSSWSSPRLATWAL